VEKRSYCPSTRTLIIGTIGMRRKIGRVALVGILANVGLAMAFLYAGSSSSSIAYAAALNTDLAFFSLFPLGALDGKKVFDWDKDAKEDLVYRLRRHYGTLVVPGIEVRQ
jgi:hypothetical protein